MRINADLPTETMLELVRTRLARVQAGPWACPANADALQCVEQALMWLRIREENLRDKAAQVPQGCETGREE